MEKRVAILKLLLLKTSFSTITMDTEVDEGSFQLSRTCKYINMLVGHVNLMGIVMQRNAKQNCSYKTPMFIHCTLGFFPFQGAHNYRPINHKEFTFSAMFELAKAQDYSCDSIKMLVFALIIS